MEGMEETDQEELWERILTGLPNLTHKDWGKLSQTAERFQYGMPNMIGAMGLRTSIDLFIELGLTKIESHIKTITTYLINRLKEKEIPLITPEPWSKRAGIVTFKPGIPIPTKEAAEKLDKHFKMAGVYLTVRGGYIRVACHLYNTEEDIDKLLDMLPLN